MTKYPGLLLLGLLASLVLLLTGSRYHDVSSLVDAYRGLREASPFEHDKPNQRSKPRGDVRVDFYRMYDEKELLGIPYRDHVISKWRLYVQVFLLNYWYNGRVRFFMGDIYSFGDPDGIYEEPVNCFEGALEFSFLGNGYIQNANHVSVLIVKRLNENLFGCVNPINVPLGGVVGFAPAMVLGMSNENTAVVSSTTAGINHIAGILISHEMGHVFGYQHTSVRDEELVVRYLSGFCGLNLRYPQFNSEITEALNEIVWDMVTGERYDYEDWKGRTNIMSDTVFNAFQLTSVWKVGMYEKQYKPIFETILDCWFNRSKVPIQYRNESEPEISFEDGGLY